MRVVVADDVMLVRSGLARLLTDAGVEVVAEAADADELLRAVASTRPDVAVVDIRMPPTHTDEGLVAARRIRDQHADTAVVLLSQHLEPRYAQRLLADQPGGLGYLLKERVSDVAVLVDALRRVCEHECVIDPTIVAQLMRRPGGEVAAEPPDAEGAGDPRAARRGPVERRDRSTALDQRAHGGGGVRPGVPEARPRAQPGRQPPGAGGADPAPQLIRGRLWVDAAWGASATLDRSTTGGGSAWQSAAFGTQRSGVQISPTRPREAAGHPPAASSLTGELATRGTGRRAPGARRCAA